jgi:hypothetical protein
MSGPGSQSVAYRAAVPLTALNPPGSLPKKSNQTVPI